jgi:hypothetical protein
MLTDSFRTTFSSQMVSIIVDWPVEEEFTVHHRVAEKCQYLADEIAQNKPPAGKSPRLIFRSVSKSAGRQLLHWLYFKSLIYEYTDAEARDPDMGIGDPAALLIIRDLVDAYITARRFGMEAWANRIVDGVRAFSKRRLPRAEFITTLEGENFENDKLKDLVVADVAGHIRQQGWSSFLKDDPGLISKLKANPDLSIKIIEHLGGQEEESGEGEETEEGAEEGEEEEEEEEDPCMWHTHKKTLPFGRAKP